METLSVTAVEDAYEKPSPEKDMIVAKFIARVVVKCTAYPMKCKSAMENWDNKSDVNLLVTDSDEAYALLLLKNNYALLKAMKDQNIKPSEPTKNDEVMVFLKNNQDNPDLIKSVCPVMNKQVGNKDGKWKYDNIQGHGYGSFSHEAGLYFKKMQGESGGPGVVMSHREYRERNQEFKKAFGIAVFYTHPTGGYNPTSKVWIRNLTRAERMAAIPAHLRVGPQPISFTITGFDQLLGTFANEDGNNDDENIEDDEEGTDV